jgi:tetratricopeptide (TPR) repeat protein
MPGDTFNSANVLAKIEASPLDSKLWQQLLAAKSKENDTLNFRPLAVLIQGIEELARSYIPGADGEGHTSQASLLDGAKRDIFVRLAKAPGNTDLLTEAGKIYLQDCRLPKVAKAHFAEAMRLGGNKDTLNDWISRAEIALNKSLESAPTGSEVVIAKHQKPKPASLIRKTGQLVLGQTAEIKAPYVPAVPSEEVAAAKLAPLSFDDLLAKTQQQIEKSRLEDAFAILQQASKHAGKSAERLWQSWTSLGFAFFDHNLMPRAVASYRAAVDLMPNEMISWFNLGVALQKNGELIEAEKCYLTADKIEPNHPKVWCNFGAVYFQMENFAASERGSRKAVRLKPDYARAWDNLGVVLGAMDRLEEAAKACEQAIKIKYDYPEPWFKLGIIYFHQERYEDAENAFKRSMKLASCAAFSSAYLSMILIRRNRLPEALKYVEEAGQLDPKCEVVWMAWNELGVALLGTGDTQKAIECYQTAIELNPNAFDAWFNFGLLHETHGHIADALECFERASAINDEDVEVLNKVAGFCTELDQPLKTAAAYQRITELTPQDANAWYNWGIVLQKLDRNNEAVKAFDKAEKIRDDARVKTANLGGALELLRQSG